MKFLLINNLAVGQRLLQKQNPGKDSKPRISNKNLIFKKTKKSNFKIPPYLIPSWSETTLDGTALMTVCFPGATCTEFLRAPSRAWEEEPRDTEKEERRLERDRKEFTFTSVVGRVLYGKQGKVSRDKSSGSSNNRWKEASATSATATTTPTGADMQHHYD